MANTTGSTGRGDKVGQAKEQAEEAKSHLTQAGAHAKEAAASAASGLAQKAQDTGSDLGQRAKDAAATVSQKAGDFASAAGDKADDALTSVGQRMASMGGSLRQSMPREGALGSAAAGVADSLESGGRYLQQHGVGDMAEDLTKAIRRNPIPALCIAFGVGFLIGMGARR